MDYAYNLDRHDVVLAQKQEINANFKALVELCRAIRYRRASDALELMDRVAEMERPIPFKRYNKHVGARSELHGRKGRYPAKAAKEVRGVIVNALANAKNKGLDTEALYIVHSSANKTRIERRYPPRGSYVWGQGTYHSHMMHSNIEYAKIEIGVADREARGLSERMKMLIERNSRKPARQVQKKQDVKKAKEPKKKEDKADEKQKQKVKA